MSRSLTLSNARENQPWHINDVIYMIYNGHPVSSPSKDARYKVVSLTTVHMYEKHAHIALPLKIGIIHRSRRLSPRRFRQKSTRHRGYICVYRHIFAVSGANNYCQNFAPTGERSAFSMRESVLYKNYRMFF